MSKRRRAGIAIAALCLVLVVAHTAVWFIATDRIRDGLPAFIESAALNGWRVEPGRVVRSGWPWAATVQLLDVTTARAIGPPSAGAGLHWHAPRIDVTLAPADPQALQVEPVGQQTVSLGDAPPMHIEAGRALLRVPLRGEPLTLTVTDLHAGSFDAQSIDATFTPGLLDGRAAGLRLDPAPPPPFDGSASITLHARISPPWPPAPTSRDAAMAWRQAGGTTDVPDLTLHWGPLEASGMAAGGLDAALQPSGTGRVRLVGALPALEAAGRSGVLQPGAVTAARAVVSLLTLAAPGQPVALPITLVDQVITVAGFPLMRLPKLLWD